MGEFNAKKNRVVWVDIPVGDLDRAAEFYKAILAVDVFKEQFGEVSFCVIEHEEGNGGCLVLKPEEVASDKGILVYMNVDGRIRDAVAKAKDNGGRVLEDVHSIGPHGFRALIVDSEGNRVALHSDTDA